jgi:hypothetical protein
MITVLFSCTECGLVDVECQVRARPKEEDVVKYVGQVVARAVQEKHTRLSILCEAKTIQDLKIPFDTDDPDGWIGKQTDQVPPRGRRPRGQQ